MNLSRIGAEGITEGIADEKPQSISFFPWPSQPKVASNVAKMPPSVSPRPTIDEPQSTDKTVTSLTRSIVRKMSSLEADDMHAQKRTSETGVDETDCFCVAENSGKLAQAWKRRRSVESTGTCSDGTVLTIDSTVYRSQFSDSLNRSFRRASSIYSSELDTSHSTRALDTSHSTLNDSWRHLDRASEPGLDEADCDRNPPGVESKAKLASAWKRRRSVESTGTCSDGTVATTASTEVKRSQLSDSRPFRRASSIYSSELDTSHSTRALDASHSTLNDASSYLGRSCSELDAPDLNLLDTHLRELNCQEKPSEGKEGHHYGVLDSQLESDILNDRDSGDWPSPGTALGPADPSTFDYCASDERSSLAVDIPLELSDHVNIKRRSSLHTIKSGVDETRQSFVTIKSIEFSLGDLDLESLGSFQDLEHDCELQK
ncbi:hypothetical protein THAOC_17019 [Thalassiosira oceanica]|uniref:Uncharacterized protein n=1 Tax=Thalassiosira oceanica TaxID=159749 RepID=K0SN46_THAOC|nr:hypothetical protein THAOC_17019 [Thalassiosira oceanica]|eukprot:EJK62371.1 hypothetical protein THAOC_17019 [Thalassiosira oceanica]